jgi:hypothetical protein
VRLLDENGMIEVKDFTLPGPKTRKFKIDDDVFDAVRVIPLGLIKGLAGLAGGVKLSNPEAGIEQTTKVMKVLLLPASYEIFERRLTDQVEPIGSEHLLPVVHWLLEQYGLRPTQPSSDSSTSSTTGEESTSSTAGASGIPWPGLSSPHTDSSILSTTGPSSS